MSQENPQYREQQNLKNGSPKKEDSKSTQQESQAQTISTVENLDRISNLSHQDGEEIQNVSQDLYVSNSAFEFNKKLDNLHSQTMQIMLRSRKLTTPRNAGNNTLERSCQLNQQLKKQSTSFIENSQGNLDSSRLNRSQSNINQFDYSFHGSFDNGNSNILNSSMNSSSFINNSEEKKRKSVRWQFDTPRDRYLAREKRFIERNKNLEPFERGRKRYFQTLVSLLIMADHFVMKSVFYKQSLRTKLWK